VFVDEDNLHRAGMGASSAESGGVERYLAWHAPGTARAKFTFPRDAALGPLFPGTNVYNHEIQSDSAAAHGHNDCSGSRLALMRLNERWPCV
jgi:hypothetical protein